ncbi:MAG: glycerol-3-phosphate 1-O-acyltransferase PlsY [Armatimonadetes bacterium]|nr:glycerol-3-phosphate 1-O-acyltransferase PlsY [Armatimonadota bacterium]
MSLLALLSAYLIGGIPLGLLLCLAWKGEDPRKHGSGNIGATNVSRILGPVGGVLVFLMDVAKGYVAVGVARWIAGQDLGSFGPWLPILAAVAALVGNNWPVWLKFKGGKGGSISLGIGLAVAPVIALLAFAVWIVTLLLTKWVSVASIVAVLSAPIWAGLLASPQDRIPLITFTCGVAALVVYRHRANIQRLMRGDEPKYRFRKEA